jgi:hypothetical protein
MQSLVSDFFARRSARDLDTTCLQRVRRPPFVTELSALTRHRTASSFAPGGGQLH